MKKYRGLNLTYEQFADSNQAIVQSNNLSIYYHIWYNHCDYTIYGIITGSLSADFRARGVEVNSGDTPTINL